MKNYQSLILLVLVGLILFTLSACSGEQSTPPVNSPPNSGDEIVTPSPNNVENSPTPELLPDYTFDEIVVNKPKRFVDGGGVLSITSEEACYYGEITISGGSYLSGQSNNLGDSYALFLIPDGKSFPSLTATISEQGYYYTATAAGKASGNKVEYPYDLIMHNKGNMVNCKKGLETALHLGGLTYATVGWGSMKISAEDTYSICTVSITKEEAVRYVQDGTLPNVLQGLTVTGLDEIFREPSIGGETISAGGVIDIATSDVHSMAIMADGTLWAWGSNMHGRIGDGTDKDRPSPVKIMDNAVSISAGITCYAITTDGSLWAWGGNQYGQLCDSNPAIRATPFVIMDNVSYITQYGGISFAIKTDGSLWAWGNNAGGLFGDDTDKNRTTPEHILDNVVSVTPHRSVSFAIKTDGSMWAWGNVRKGSSLGDGTTEKSNVPIHIMDNVTSISTSGNHSFIITSDGSLWAWGSNTNGELGTDERDAFATPTKIMDGVVSATAVRQWSFAIKTDGSLWAWGDNGHYSQLGNGQTRQQVTSPEKIMDGVTTIIPGGGSQNFTMAIKTDGSLWAWGANSQYELGDGTKETRLLPVWIMDDVDSVSTGGNFCLALKAGGSLWTWGASNAEPTIVIG